MKQETIFTVIILFFGVNLCTAQTSFGDIEYRSTGFGPVFSQKGQPLKMRDLKRITRDNPEAHQFMEKAGTNNDLSNVFGVIGGVLVGWPIGTALGGGDPNWTLAAAGGAFIAISIPFAIGFKKNAIKGAELYNQSRKTSSHQTGELRFHAGSSGIGISFSY